MGFFITPTAALLLCLSVVFSSASAYGYGSYYTSYTPIAQVPAPSPVPAPEPIVAEEESEASLDLLNHYTVVPMEEKALDKQYLKAHMITAADKVERFLSTEVESRLNDPDTSDSDKACLSLCKEVYESALDAMKTGTESVAAGDFIKANFDVSGFMTNIDTCDECFDAFQEFDGWAKSVSSDCLDKIVKYSN